jgi:probable poly-beta-1,6-N-acetyl-D-glucosamine export protein
MPCGKARWISCVAVGGCGRYDREYIRAMNRQFGALGGLAILVIVLNHSIEWALHAPVQYGYPPVAGWQYYLLTTLKELGVFAVPTFLFISGCFVSYAAQGEPPRLSGKFMISSLRHIVIPYVIWSIVFYISIFFTLGDRYTLTGYLKNLLVGYPYHFVPLLIFFYVVSPLMVRIGKSKWGIPMLVMIGLYQLALIDILHPGILGFTFPKSANFLAVKVLRTTLAEWAIYFPLGLVYGLQARKWVPFLKKSTRVLVMLTLLFFGVGLLDVFSLIRFPIAFTICPLTLVMLLPIVKRDFIPWVRFFERIGRRTYGIYLSHLLILNLFLYGLAGLLPALFQFPVLTSALFLIVGLGIPLFVMESVARSRVKQAYRYVFG